MGFDIAGEVADTVGRAHYCFWFRDRRKRVHAVSDKIVILILFLIVAILTLFGSGTSAVSYAIYAVFFLVALTMASFVVLVRSYRIARYEVVILVEAYVVALLITIMLMSHNMFYPIEYFSSSTDVDVSTAKQIQIAFLYSLPSAAYLTFRSLQFSRDRTRFGARHIKEPAHLDKLAGIQANTRVEVVAWSVFHYAVIGCLVWSLIFALSGEMSVLDNATAAFKFW